MICCRFITDDFFHERKAFCAVLDASSSSSLVGFGTREMTSFVA